MKVEAMRFFKTKRAFTLMEVNLAIFIMAVGLLAMVALYPLAYRESRQSQDDVKAAAVADCVLNMLTATLSSRNIKWEDWVRGIERAIQSDGWLAYCDNTQNSYAPKKRNQINSQAKQVFSALTGINKDYSPFIPENVKLIKTIAAFVAVIVLLEAGLVPAILTGLMLWAVALLFDYGCELQNESDEIL